MSSRWVIATLGATATLAVALSFAVVAPVARGAGPGVTPDPAPQAAPSGTGSAPTPDAAPQAPPAPTAASGSSSRSAGPAATAPTPGAVASPAASATPPQTASTTTSTPVITAPPTVRRPARSGAHRLHHGPNWIAEIAHQLSARWRENPFDIGGAASSRAAVPAREGILLLFGAVALAVLALASGSMLRLLRGMEEVRTP